MKKSLSVLILILLFLSSIPKAAENREGVVFTGFHGSGIDREMFALKESKEIKKECNETNCVQDIGMRFNSELIVNVAEVMSDQAKTTEPQLAKATEGMVHVKGGCFQMGDTFGDGELDEKPVHEACVNDFSIGDHEVTQGEWKKVMGKNPSRFSSCGDDCPVENVSWNDIQEFFKKINQQTGGNYRFPTEAEWEYAARSGGNKEKWAGTSSESALGDYAWYSSNSNSKTHAVKQKRPNGIGLYDMTGNVWEWVSDLYGSDYIKSGLKDNPEGASHGSDRVSRGGGWSSGPGDLRASYRDSDLPDARRYSLGFRLARSY